MEERRKYIRFDVPIKVELMVRGVIDYLQKGVTKDFSREGVRLVLHDCKLTEGAEVNLKLYIPNHRDPVSVKGEIVWMKPMDDNWEFGVKIINIDSGIKSEILDYAYHIWREKGKE